MFPVFNKGMPIQASVLARYLKSIVCIAYIVYNIVNTNLNL